MLKEEGNSAASPLGRCSGFDGEAGQASLLGLCMVFIVLLLGMAIMQMLNCGLQNSDSCLLEMRMRLAAESSLEKAVTRIEESGRSRKTGLTSISLPADGKDLPALLQEDEYRAETELPITVKVYLTELVPGEKAVVEAWASVPEDGFRFRWLRSKPVKGWLEIRDGEGSAGKGKSYIWRGWLEK